MPRAKEEQSFNTGQKKVNPPINPRGRTVIEPTPKEGTHTARGVGGPLSLPQFHSVATLA